MTFSKLLPVLVSFMLFCSDLPAPTQVKYPHPEKLENKTLVITVSYGAIACECAQWMLVKNKGEREYIFLEPASKQLINARHIWDGNHLPLQLRLTGKFYIGTGFPENYKLEKGGDDPAKVFRYDKIEILTPYFKKHYNPKNG